MFKKLSAVLLVALLLVGCSSGSSKNDFKKETTDYINLSLESKWDDAEKLASLDMSNPFKDEAKYIKDSVSVIKDTKKKFGDEKYESLNKKLTEATAVSKMIKEFKINKSEEDEADMVVVKVTATMLSSSKMYDKFYENINELDSAQFDLSDKLVDNGMEYDEAEKEAIARTYNDEAANKILKIVEDCYGEQVMKFVFSKESGKLQYISMEN